MPCGCSAVRCRSGVRARGRRRRTADHLFGRYRPTKFVAKVASRGEAGWTHRGSAGQVAAFLHPLPVEAMWGVGNATAQKLHRLGIYTVGDLATRQEAVCVRPSARTQAACSASWRGEDRRRVTPLEPEHSVGSQETFRRDTDDPDTVRRELLRMADRTAHRMRKQQMVGRTVTISVRFADFTELTRSATLPAPTDVTVEIYAQALELYERLGVERARIRRVGVRVEQLVDRHRVYRQPQLTDPERGWRGLISLSMRRSESSGRVRFRELC